MRQQTFSPLLLSKRLFSFHNRPFLRLDGLLNGSPYGHLHTKQPPRYTVNRTHIDRYIYIQVNKKFCELKEGITGIVEKAQETRCGMSSKYSRYIGIALESCFVSYVIVKSPSVPYIIVHLFSIVL